MDYAFRKAELIAYKGGKCMDCGGVFPQECYDFDHRDVFAKGFNVSRKIYRPMEELIPEVDKCDLVCSNCHRIRTSNSKSLHEKVSKALTGKSRKLKEFCKRGHKRTKENLYGPSCRICKLALQKERQSAAKE